MCNNVPHKHASVIKAWADGAKIQVRVYNTDWLDTPDPDWDVNRQYRIKPEPKPDKYTYIHATFNDARYSVTKEQTVFDNIKITFDGETGKLKSVEIIK